MNNGRPHIPHPAVIYLILLVTVILVSWIAELYTLRSVSRNSDILFRSLLDVDGLRWFIRNSTSVISSAPVGNALLILSAVGVVRDSGIVAVAIRLWRGRAVAYKEKSGYIASMAVLFMLLLLIAQGIFGGRHVLLGLSGTLSSSPLLSGAVLLCFLLVGLPSVVYGLTSGRFRCVDDVIDALVSLYIPYASFFLTLLVGTQLLAVLDYSGLTRLLNIGASEMRILSFVVWWAPLPYLYLRQKQKN